MFVERPVEDIAKTLDTEYAKTVSAVGKAGDRFVNKSPG